MLKPSITVTKRCVAEIEEKSLVNMGFDNECIINMQSLAGEYFCPVCRLLVYPNEALQSQCTHLYCKPCLTYTASTTRACPYDGYLVTKADSNPLVESNKTLAETIGKVAVHCLYHRSGCTWQGPLSDCTSHCSGCTFGDSPVVCNRCGIQIVHRQVQEHAQNCPGVPSQVPQAEAAPSTTTTGTVIAADQNQTATGAGTAAFPTQPSQVTTTPAPVNQQGHPNAQTQPVVQAAAPPTAELWYQQYYQQYPGYDPYQQYQQYYPYQQHLQAHPTLVGQQPQAHPPQPQPQPQIRSQHQTQPPQSHQHVQTPVAIQPQSQGQVNPQQQLPAVQPHLQIQPQTQAPHGLSQPQVQPQTMQPHPQYLQVPQYLQSQTHVQHAQPQLQPQQFPPPKPQTHLEVQSQVQLQPSQPQSSQPLNSIVQPQAHHPSAHAVTGHHSYPQHQAYQQMQLGNPYQNSTVMHPQGVPQYPVPMQSQFPLQAQQVRPPQFHPPVLNQQQPALVPSPGQVPNIPPAQQQPVIPHAQQPGYALHQRPVMQLGSQPQQYEQQRPPPFAGQPLVSVQNQLHQQGPVMQQQMPLQSQLRPQGLHSIQQHTNAYPQPQKSVSLSHGRHPHQSENLGGRLGMPNHGVQSQGYPQSVGIQARSMQLGADQGHLLGGQHSGASSRQPLMDQEIQSSSHRTANKDAVSGLADAGEIKPRISENDVKSTNDEHKAVGEVEKKIVLPETVLKDTTESLRVVTDPELRVVEDGESVAKQIVKEEGSKEPSNSDTSGIVVEDLKNGYVVASQKMGHPALRDKKMQEHLEGKGEMKDAAPHYSDQNAFPEGAISGSEVKHLQQHAQGTQFPRFDEYKGFPPTSQGQAASFVQHSDPGSFADQGGHPPPIPYGPYSSLQQKPPGYPYSHSQGHKPFPQSGQPSNPSDQFPVQHPGPDTVTSFGSSRNHPSHYGPPQGPYNLQLPHSGALRSQGESVGGPPPHGTLHRGTFDLHGGMMEGAPLHGPEGQIGDQLPGYNDGQRPGPRPPGRGPLRQPHGTEMNGARGLESSAALGLRDERFKSSSDDHLNPFPVDPARHMNGRGEFDEDFKRYPRPHLDADPVPEYGNYSSGPLNRNAVGFGMDVGSRVIEKGHLKYDTGLKVDPGLGTAPSRFMHPYHRGGVFHPTDASERPVGFPEDTIERSDSVLTHSGIRQHHVGGLMPRSPHRGYPGMPPHEFGGRPGVPSLDDIDMESHRFGDQIGSSFHEGRFPVMPSHLYRGEFEDPGNLRRGEHFRNGDLIGQDILPNHLRRVEHLGPRHLRFGEPGGFSAFPGPGQMGELAGPGNFNPHSASGNFFGGSRPTHPRLDEPGFRSSLSLPGDVEPFNNSRKRKSFSMGWCRICKVDCETVEGLDFHSQTMGHQKIAVDMVRIIKQKNSKKHKLNSSDYSSIEDANKSKSASFENRGNKH